jgi:hypothetical protein
MAAEGRGRWSPAIAAIWLALGVVNVLYIGTYRTVFTASGVQQARFLRRMRTYSYSDVQSVRIGKGKSANAITMAFTDGRKMTVYGPEKQLIKAQLLLSDRVPRVGREPSNRLHV